MVMSLSHTRDDVAPERVVVVGATGFVGSAVARTASDAGIAVEAVGSAEVDLLAADAAATLAARLRPGDALVLVSAIAPARSAADVAANLHMAQAVLDALVSSPVDHVVYISSDAVYAEAEALVSEATPPSPTSLHGVMHLARELALRQAVGDRLAVLRPTLLYGVDDPHNGYGPNRFLRQAAAGEEITLFGEGEETRDHVHVDDLAAVVLGVLRRRSTGTLDVATGESHAFGDVARLAVALTGSTSSVTGTPRKNPVTHRHFDVAARLAAFPTLALRSLGDGLAGVVAQRG